MRETMWILLLTSVHFLTAQTAASETVDHKGTSLLTASAVKAELPRYHLQDYADFFRKYGYDALRQSGYDSAAPVSSPGDLSILSAPGATAGPYGGGDVIPQQYNKYSYGDVPSTDHQVNPAYSVRAINPYDSSNNAFGYLGGGGNGVRGLEYYGGHMYDPSQFYNLGNGHFPVAAGFNNWDSSQLYNPSVRSLLDPNINGQYPAGNRPFFDPGMYNNGLYQQQQQQQQPFYPAAGYSSSNRFFDSGIMNNVYPERRYWNMDSNLINPVDAGYHNNINNNNYDLNNLDYSRYPYRRSVLAAGAAAAAAPSYLPSVAAAAAPSYQPAGAPPLPPPQYLVPNQQVQPALAAPAAAVAPVPPNVKVRKHYDVDLINYEHQVPPAAAAATVKVYHTTPAYNAPDDYTTATTYVTTYTTTYVTTYTTVYVKTYPTTTYATTYTTTYTTVYVTTATTVVYMDTPAAATYDTFPNPQYVERTYGGAIRSYQQQQQQLPVRYDMDVVPLLPTAASGYDAGYEQRVQLGAPYRKKDMLPSYVPPLQEEQQQQQLRGAYRRSRRLGSESGLPAVVPVAS